MKAKQYGSSRFQPGEGPSRGLLRDCKTLNFAKVSFELQSCRKSRRGVRRICRVNARGGVNIAADCGINKDHEEVGRVEMISSD